MAAVLEGLSSATVMRCTGATHRQLDYWIRTGVIVPSVHRGRGSRRPHHWSEGDVDIVGVLVRLARLGGDDKNMSTDVLAAAAKAMRRNLAGRWLVVGATGSGHVGDDLGTVLDEMGGAGLVVDLERSDLQRSIGAG